MSGSSPASAAFLQKAWNDLQSDSKLALAVEEEAEKRTAELLACVHKFNRTDFTRDIPEPNAVITIGSARLLDYGCDKANAPAILLIPSLINRYYIMDLTKRLSFARYLREHGIRVFIVDWGTPREQEYYLNCALYVTEVLVPMAEYIRRQTTGSLAYGGYCMGGLLAMALACTRPELADKIAFFATPWDFLAPSFPRFALEEPEIEELRKQLNARDTIPAEFIHLLFHYANPCAFQNKLKDFAAMDPAAPATQDFIAIEHWATDGIDMTRGVAHDCLINWTQYNQPAKGQWHVGGRPVLPQELTIPSFVAIPKDDKIVPSDCALPLTAQLKNPTLIEPYSGHISMMAGRRRKSALWEPFREWLVD
ncbi:MAG TPA: alpha/beta fold hydrolase [Rickettsiales bacterium]|nr:alpha/beta fold hydrolase [Rickettsiales bacterium]